jgi:hypothetical protein
MRDRKNHVNRRYEQKIIIILGSKDLIVNKKVKTTHQNRLMDNCEWF